MKKCDKMWNNFGKCGENHQNMLNKLIWTIKAYAEKTGKSGKFPWIGLNQPKHMFFRADALRISLSWPFISRRPVAISSQVRA
jgi:hypothetical protein